jgi:hypothetical protein
MPQSRLSNRIWRGLGTAARAIGARVDAYRPLDGGDPLRPENRFLRLPASFMPPSIKRVRPGGYGEALWEGVFDASCTRPGDFLVGEDGAIWFVATQPPTHAPQCVRALRRLSFSRPSGPVAAGANLYGGVVRSTAAGVLAGWPAAMFVADGVGQNALATATDIQQGVWSVLLPPQEWLGLLAGDAMTDDLGRCGVVETADYTEMGWRLLVRQSTA